MQTTAISPAITSQTREGAPIAAMAHQAVHDSVMQILESLGRGAILDVPAGQGALAARLAAAGFGVRCCDLYPEIFRLQGVEIRQGDLDGALPYDDREFDYLTCVEGLEHIENPHQAIREFSRVLRPGGHLIVSIPNVLNVEERLKWLLHGYTSHFKPITREQVERSRLEHANREEIALHINTIDYSQLRYMLEENGFQVAGIYRDKPKAHAWLYSPIVVLVRLIARLTPARKRKERWTEELSSDEILLGGNTLVVHAILSEVGSAI